MTTYPHDEPDGDPQSPEGLTATERYRLGYGGDELPVWFGRDRRHCDRRHCPHGVLRSRCQACQDIRARTEMDTEWAVRVKMIQGNLEQIRELCAVNPWSHEIQAYHGGDHSAIPISPASVDQFVDAIFQRAHAAIEALNGGI